VPAEGPAVLAAVALVMAEGPVVAGLPDRVTTAQLVLTLLHTIRAAVVAVRVAQPQQQTLALVAARVARGLRRL